MKRSHWNAEASASESEARSETRSKLQFASTQMGGEAAEPRKGTPCHPRNDETPEWRRRSGTLQGNITDPLPCASQDCKCRNGQEDLRYGARRPAWVRLRSSSRERRGLYDGDHHDWWHGRVTYRKKSDDDLKESIDKTEDEAKGFASEITGQGHAAHDRTPCWHWTQGRPLINQTITPWMARPSGVLMENTFCSNTWVITSRTQPQTSPAQQHSSRAGALSSWNPGCGDAPVSPSWHPQYTGAHSHGKAVEQQKFTTYAWLLTKFEQKKKNTRKVKK